MINTQINSNILDITINPNWNGEGVVTITASDQHGEELTNHHPYHNNDDNHAINSTKTFEIFIRVNPVNDPPIARINNIHDADDDDNVIVFVLDSYDSTGDFELNAEHQNLPSDQALDSLKTTLNQFIKILQLKYNYASYDIDADSDNFESVFGNDQLTYRWYVWTSESDSNNNALADENEYILKNKTFLTTQMEMATINLIFLTKKVFMR